LSIFDEVTRGTKCAKFLDHPVQPLSVRFGYVRHSVKGGTTEYFISLRAGQYESIPTVHLIQVVIAYHYDFYYPLETGKQSTDLSCLRTSLKTARWQCCH